MDYALICWLIILMKSLKCFDIYLHRKEDDKVERFFNKLFDILFSLPVLLYGCLEN